MGRFYEMDDYRKSRHFREFTFRDEVVGIVDGDRPIVMVTENDGNGLCLTRADARRLCAALLVAIQRAEDVL